MNQQARGISQLLASWRVLWGRREGRYLTFLITGMFGLGLLLTEPTGVPRWIEAHWGLSPFAVALWSTLCPLFILNHLVPPSCPYDPFFLLLGTSGLLSHVIARLVMTLTVGFPIQGTVMALGLYVLIHILVAHPQVRGDAHGQQPMD